VPKRELDPTAWMNSGLGKIFTAGGALRVLLAVAQKRAMWSFDWLSYYNQTLEGAMRLFIYKVAIDNGVSKPRAAALPRISRLTFSTNKTKHHVTRRCWHSTMTH
jgi:hypothetical protein